MNRDKDNGVRGIFEDISSGYGIGDGYGDGDELIKLVKWIQEEHDEYIDDILLGEYSE